MSNLVDYMQTDSGSGRVTRLAPRVDPGGGDKLMWDVDITSEIDEAGAKAIQGSVPQAPELLARARDKQGSAIITIRPAERTVDLVLTNEDGVVACQTMAEIRYIKLRTAEKKMAYIARLRVFALDREASADLVMCLGKVASISVDPRQQSMDFSAGQPKLGDIVHARAGDGSDVFGVYRAIKRGKHVVDDFGALHRAETIVSRLTVNGADDADVLARYTDPVNEAGGTPTWADIVTALAAANATGDSVPGQAWDLTAEVAEAAAQAQSLPAEPGDENGGGDSGDQAGASGG